jgi:hypothetical protein
MTRKNDAVEIGNGGFILGEGAPGSDSFGARVSVDYFRAAYLYVNFASRNEMRYFNSESQVFISSSP